MAVIKVRIGFVRVLINFCIVYNLSFSMTWLASCLQSVLYTFFCPSVLLSSLRLTRVMQSFLKAKAGLIKVSQTQTYSRLRVTSAHVSSPVVAFRQSLTKAAWMMMPFSDCT